jgi:hypothetical protein
MPQETQSVAYNLCKQDYYEVVGTFLECSLCNAGWPMKTGRIAFSFYTVPCRLATGTETYVNENANYPSPSWFWGFEQTEIQLACPPVGEGQEYAANIWVGRAERSSRPTSDGASILLEVLAKFTQINNTTAQVDLQFNVLVGSYWQPYFNVSTSLVRKDANLCLPCGRSYASDFIPVSPSSVVCHGDLRFIKISAGTSPWFEGCGPEVESLPGLSVTGPVCSFFDGTRMFTCFRALFYNLNPSLSIQPTFTQMGMDKDACAYTDPSVSGCTGACTYVFLVENNGAFNTWVPLTDTCSQNCACVGPPPWWTVPGLKNGDTYTSGCASSGAQLKCNCLYGKKTGQNSVSASHFLVLDNYFNLGCPGESDTAFQKVQLGSFSGTGYEIIAKDVGNGSLCFVLRATSFPYAYEVASSVTVVSDATPYVMQVDFAMLQARVFIYAMKFPNPDILPELCYTGTGTTPNCGNFGINAVGVNQYICSGICTYVFSSLFEAWVLDSSNCHSNMGYTCSCPPPPDPATLSPYPTEGQTYQTECR